MRDLYQYDLPLIKQVTSDVFEYTNFTLESLKMLVAGLRVMYEDFILYYNETCYIGHKIKSIIYIDKA